MISQTIYSICELSKLSKIPFLLVSNPGYKKTLGVREYAKRNNYHLECLIGSRSTPEELLGYQVNDGSDSLKHLDAQWWHRIIEYEKKGVHSVLFCDEISTCSPQVQGSMFSLIQDRMNNKGELLPESTIIVAAANYAGNLTSYMDILPPTLNRFCIMNIAQNMNGLDVVDEIFDSKEVNEYSYEAMNDATAKEYYAQIKEVYSNMFKEYSDTKSAKGCLDVSNTNFSMLYQDSSKALYNFITIRTLWNLKEILKLCIECKMTNADFISMIIDGFIGAGTCNFDEAQANAYRNMMHRSLQSIVDRFSGASKAAEAKLKDAGSLETVSDACNALLMNSQKLNASEYKKELEYRCIDLIDNIYVNNARSFVLRFSLPERHNDLTFVSDIESAEELYKSYDFNDIALKEKVLQFLQLFMTYYVQYVENKDILDVDLNSLDMFKDYTSALYKSTFFGEKLDKNGRIQFIQIALSKEGNKFYETKLGMPMYNISFGTPIEDYSKVNAYIVMLDSNKKTIDSVKLSELI